jgi:hypothetical protein
MAPQFLTEEDINMHLPGNEYLFWSSGGWKSGSLSRTTTANPRPERVSSYAVLDTILLKIARNNPNLRNIIVAGHSAGGQFVNRYASSSLVITMLCSQYRIPVRSIMANPSSYLYLDNQRRVAGSLDQFAVPMDSCSGYNKYKYGLDNLYSYLSVVGASLIRQQYTEREVIYLLGGNDNNPNSSSLDISCEAMLQGNHRLERGTIFFNYLRYYYGKLFTETHSKIIIKGVGHNIYQMFNSVQGVNAIMKDDSLCLCSNVTVINKIPDNSGGLPYFSRGKLMAPNSNIDTGPSTIKLFDLTGKNISLIYAVSRSQIRNFNGIANGVYFIKNHRGNIIKFISIWQ